MMWGTPYGDLGSWGPGVPVRRAPKAIKNWAMVWG